MLTQEENALLTQVGPGKPMGELMRRYWIPAAFSHQLAKPDAPRIRVRLMGENLVAFRDTQGRVGLFDEAVTRNEPQSKAAERRPLRFPGSCTKIKFHRRPAIRPSRIRKVRGLIIVQIKT